MGKGGGYFRLPSDSGEKSCAAGIFKGEPQEEPADKRRDRQRICRGGRGAGKRKNGGTPCTACEGGAIAGAADWHNEMNRSGQVSRIGGCGGKHKEKDA